MDMEKLFREAAQQGANQVENNDNTEGATKEFESLLTAIGNFRKGQKKDSCVLFGDFTTATKQYMLARIHTGVKLEDVESSFFATFMQLLTGAADDVDEDSGANLVEAFMQQGLFLCLHIVDKEQQTPEERQLMFAFAVLSQDMMNQADE